MRIEDIMFVLQMFVFGGLICAVIIFTLILSDRSEAQTSYQCFRYTIVGERAPGFGSRTPGFHAYRCNDGCSIAISNDYSVGISCSR